MIEFLRRIWSYVRPYQSRFILGLLCGVLFAIANAGLMIAVKLVVNIVFAPSGKFSLLDEVQRAPVVLRAPAERLVSVLPELQSPSSRLALALALSTIPLAMFFRVLFNYLNVYLVNWAALRAIVDLRARLFDHLQNLSLSFFSRASTGELISRISNDTLVVQSIIANAFASLIKDPISVIVLFGLMLSQQPRLTLISLLVFPLCVMPIVIYGRKVRLSSRAVQTHTAELTNLMHEAFTANRIVKAYNLEATVFAQFQETSRRFFIQMMRIVRAQELPGTLIEFFAAIGVSLFLYFVFLRETRVTPGDFSQFFGSILLMYPSLKSLSRLYSQIAQARAASQRIFELLETQNAIREPARPVPLQATGSPIHFDDIHFSYGDKLVLQGIQLTVESGTMVALVGASGSGKTTLTNLLLRFYDPQKGAVRIGDTDIRDVTTRDLRARIAVVTQETILFNDTIRNNIALGRPGANNGEIEEAGKHAFAHEFILEKPNGYETVIGEKGVMLSGGQRQRIAIARAILKNAPILVLDEATSALDTESERAVQAALEELMIGRTTICIAHRLSTVQRADLIVVLDQGRIVEAGKHTELLKRGGVYQKLYELQFQS